MLGPRQRLVLRRCRRRVPVLGQGVDQGASRPTTGTRTALPSGSSSSGGPTPLPTRAHRRQLLPTDPGAPTAVRSGQEINPCHAASAAPLPYPRNCSMTARSSGGAGRCSGHFALPRTSVRALAECLVPAARALRREPQLLETLGSSMRLLPASTGAPDPRVETLVGVRDDRSVWRSDERHWGPRRGPF